MATDQVENEPPLSEQQPALPVLNYIEAFRPLVPTEDMQSTSQRLQHIFVTNGSPASFGLVVSKQWRADRANGRNTWAVVGTALEVELLEQDLTSGAAADVPGESIGPEFVWAPSLDETIAGVGVVIVTFEHLVAFLGGCLQEDRTWQWDASCGSPTVVMNFGWGNMSFEMAFACPLLARLIEDTMLTGPQVIMACTVSSDDRPYFGRSWRHVEMQEVSVLTRGPRITPKYYFTEEMSDVKLDGLREMDTLLSEISNNNARMEGERTLLLVDDSQHCIMSWTSEPLITYRAQRLRGADAGDIALGSKTPYVGQVGRLSNVIIYPFVDAFTRHKGQIALGEALCGMPRSQAEVNYHSRYNQESDAPPQVHIMMKEEYVRLLPVHCEHSAAHTLHLARLLVCCKFIWAEAPLAEIPVLLPEDKSAVLQEMEHLSAKGIMDQNYNPLPPQVDMEGDSDLDEGMDLTPLGRTTAAILMKGVRSLHSAHLLAQLPDTSEEYRTLNKTSRPVVEAILALAVLTEVQESNITSPTKCFGVKKWPGPDQKAWYNDNVKGISEGKVGRGPLWLAAGLWQILINDYELRGPLAHVRATGLPPNAVVQLCWDSISLNIDHTLQWDLRLVNFSKICTLFSDMDLVNELGETTLTDEEELAVEVALVRAFMDRIMMVESLDEGPGGDSNGLVFQCWDLSSGDTLASPPGSQDIQLWWEDRHRRDELADEDKSPVMFCVYSFILYDRLPLGNSSYGRVRRPVDATYVSARAVRLAFEGTEAYSKVNDPVNYLGILRWRLRQES